jgi:hypothetical protein
MYYKHMKEDENNKVFIIRYYKVLACLIGRVHN